MTKTGDTERKLVAIFAADVEGYSRLMGVDEVGTLRNLTHRRGILDGLVASRRGRIANTAGDSVLAEFGSAVDAVQCAVEAQEALSEANTGLSPDRHINFRIGVHVGDVMIKGGDLFGDIAARLQTLARWCELKDSLLGANQIQGFFLGGSLGCEGPFGFERRGVGADGAADHRSA